MRLTAQITALITTLAAVANTSNAATIAEWNFNSTGSGTTAERLPVALGASGVASGLTVTPLNVNASFDLAGLNNVPNTVNDGYGFGSNSGQNVMFIHRADHFNGGGLVTTWGDPANTSGVSTTVGNSPLSFTISADSLTTLTLNSVNIAGLGGANFIVYFQEAGAVSGSASSTGSNTSETASLTNPVVIGAGQSKTFTINLNSGSLNSAHLFNSITLDGTVTAVPEPSMVAWLPALLGTALFRRRRAQKNQA